MSQPEITRHVAAAAIELRTALHHPINELTVPELYNILSETQPLVDGLHELARRVAQQFDRRLDLGGVSHDTSAAELIEEIKGAAEALDDMLRMLKAVHACLGDAHDAMSHLTDTGSRS